MKSILSILTLVLFLNITNSVGAFKGHVFKETAIMVMAYSPLAMEEFMKDNGKKDYLTEWVS